MPDLSDLVPTDSGQVRNFNVRYLSSNKYIKKAILILNFLTFIYYNALTHCMENSVDPDQLIWIYTVSKRVYIWLHTIFKIFYA